MATKEQPRNIPKKPQWSKLLGKCPDCGKTFQTWSDLSKHMEEHKEKAALPTTPVAIGKYKAKYFGGHVAFVKETDGVLHLYSEPESKIVFTSNTATFEIPFGKIKDSKIATEKELSLLRIALMGLAGLALKKKTKFLVITYEDAIGGIQNPVFKPDLIEEFSSDLYRLRLKSAGVE